MLGLVSSSSHIAGYIECDQHSLVIVLVLVWITPWTLRDLCLRSFVQKGPECLVPDCIADLSLASDRGQSRSSKCGMVLLVIHSCASVLLANLLYQEDLQTVAACSCCSVVLVGLCGK